MKKSITFASVLAFGMTFSAAASAERFNDRGPVSFDTPSSSRSATAVTNRPLVSSRFNDRGEHFATEAPRGSQRPLARVVAQVGQGFNDRSSSTNFRSGAGPDHFNRERVAQADFGR